MPTSEPSVSEGMAMLEGTSGVTPVEGGLEVLLGVPVLDAGVSFFAESRRNRGSYMSAHVLLN